MVSEIYVPVAVVCVRATALWLRSCRHRVVKRVLGIRPWVRTVCTVVAFDVKVIDWDKWSRLGWSIVSRLSDRPTHVDYILSHGNVINA